jgi:hypothetical protein
MINYFITNSVASSFPDQSDSCFPVKSEFLKQQKKPFSKAKRSAFGITFLFCFKAYLYGGEGFSGSR